jgi:hypothetical protein
LIPGQFLQIQADGFRRVDLGQTKGISKQFALPEQAYVFESGSALDQQASCVFQPFCGSLDVDLFGTSRWVNVDSWSNSFCINRLGPFSDLLVRIQG